MDSLGETESVTIEPRENLRDQLGGAALAGGVVVGLSAILLARNPNLFWNDDYQLSILPVFADVARSWSEGHLPLLSPYSWVCNNLAGEFQYGTFSAFVNAAVIFIWKFPLTFAQQAAALSMAHLFPLGMGGYLLARARKMSPPLSLMVSLVTAANGWIVAWGATDWFGALGALTWLPWSWWSMERALDPARSRWRFLWPAPFVYLLVTGGFPYTVLMLGLIGGWLGVKALAQTRRLAALGPLALGLSLGAGLSSPAWLALFDYLHGSAREVQDKAAHFQWVVPPAALPGFILPSWTVNWADFSTRQVPHTAIEMACGLVPPAALLFGLAIFGRRLVRQIRWELALLVVVLAISMLPTASVFRWSFRWLPLIHLVLALCAAKALQLYAASSPSTRSWRRLLLRPGMVALALLAFCTASTSFTQAARPNWKLIGAFAAFASLWAASDFLPERMRTVRAWMPPAITFAALLATYLLLPTNAGVPRYDLAQNLTQPAPLDPERLYLSVYPAPEYRYHIGVVDGPIGRTIRPGSTSMWSGLRFINGYSPIRPAGVAREFDSAIHGELAPWACDFSVGYQAGPDGVLEKIGVDGIVVAKKLELAPKPENEWNLVEETEEGRVYHRRGAPLPRVRSMASDDSRPNEQFARAAVTLVEDSRQRVVADVRVPAGGAPALLSFSRPYFRGYQARLDAKKLAVTSYRGLMPTVEIPAGASGRLVLRYRPWWLVAGGITAAVCAGICLTSAACALARRR